MEVTLQTLTPIWTGGVDAKADRLHATGIIGSLRWWYEVIVRGLGGWACDPASDNPEERCHFDTKAYEDAKRTGLTNEQALAEGLKTVCPVCFLFGCGGWRRQFRFDVIKAGSEPLCLATLDSAGKFNNWWLSQIFRSGSLASGDVKLKFVIEKAREALIQNQLRALLSVMAHVGAIGAKTQYGFGQFDWDGKLELKDALRTVKAALNSYFWNRNYNEQNNWYRLNEFWFFEVKLPLNNPQLAAFSKANTLFYAKLPEKYLPVSFDIRYKLPNTEDKGVRQYYRLKVGKIKTREVFGTLIGNKIGSKVFVSHLFKRLPDNESYYLRIWGFTEENVLPIIEDQIKNIFSINNELNPVIGSKITQEVMQG